MQTQINTTQSAKLSLTPMWYQTLSRFSKTLSPSELIESKKGKLPSVIDHAYSLTAFENLLESSNHSSPQVESTKNNDLKSLQNISKMPQRSTEKHLME